MRALSKLCLMVTLLGAAGSAATAAPAQSLNGTWQVQRTAAAELGALGDKWEETAVPAHLQQAAEPYAWFRRTFTLPDAAAGRHVVLSFGGVKFASEVYMNRQRVGVHYGGWEPFEVEVTAAARPGPNELIVRVQDVRAVIDGSVPYSPSRNLVEAVKGRVMAPVGSQTNLFGIWQDVNLILRDDVYTEDVTVVTSVRQKHIEARYVLRNVGNAPLTVRLAAIVRDGDATALDLGSTDVAVPAGGTAGAAFSKPWADPKLWSPDSPHLYRLESRLSSGGRELDATNTRFGFREFWTDGIYLVLNGARIKFLATAGHPPWEGRLLTSDEIRAKFEAIRGANVMAMRLHANVWPENWYEVADEIGLPIIQESAIWCYSENYALERKEFWDNAREHWRSVIQRDRNHPAVVMYSIENEMLHVGGNRVPATEKNLGDLGRFVKSLDPTRPIMYDGDEDPDGVADVINLHYPHEFPDNTLYPNTCCWLDQKTRITGWPYREWEWNRRKPLYLGEFLWVGAPSPQACTLFLGDDAYRDFDRAHFQSKAIAWEMQVQAYRAAEVAGMCPWTLWESGTFPNEQYDAVRRAYEHNGAFVKEYDTRFHVGDNVERTVSLYNDTLQPADLTLEWKLAAESVGQKTFPLRPGERVETTISFTPQEYARKAPADTMPADFELTVRNGDREVYRSKHGYTIFPPYEPRFTVPPGVRIAVYDRDGTLAGVLRRGGLEPAALDDLAQVGTSGAQVLVIAPHSLDALAAQEEMPVVGAGAHAALSGFVRSGGTVLVLEQDKYPQDMLPASLQERGATIAFKRNEAGLLLDGLDENAFKFWRGDHMVADRLLGRPREGGFRVFVDTGGPNGLDGTLLLEVLQGRGRYIMSQLLIGKKLGREPLAGVMLERLVSYAAAQSSAGRPVGLVRGSRKLDNDLKNLGAPFDDLTARLPSADLSRYSVLVLDGTSDEALSAQQRLRDFVQEGGKVLLHGVSDDAMRRLSAVLPAGLTVRPNLHVPVLINRKDDEVMAGMTNEDLCWIAKAGDWQTRSTLDTGVLYGELMRPVPPLARCTVVEAETMRLPDAAGRAAVENGEVAMWTNASAEADVVLPRTGEYFFGIVGRGTPAAGAFPDVTVYLDGKSVGHIQAASREASAFAIVGGAEAGRHVLRLSFDNDTWDPEKGEDRNLWLDKFFFAPSEPGPEKVLLRPAGLVKLEQGKGFWLLDEVAWDGRTASSDQAARYLCGLLTNLGAAFTAAEGAVTVSAARMETTMTENFRREAGVAYMGSNGAIAIDVRFAASGQYSFVVNARGTPADGQYPAIRLLIDGKPVGDGQIQQGGWENLSFRADVTAGVHKLTVEFTNDAWRPERNEDRNLWVRHVLISP